MRLNKEKTLASFYRYLRWESVCCSRQPVTCVFSENFSLVTCVFSDNLSRVLSLVTCVLSDNLSRVLWLVTCVFSYNLSRVLSLVTCVFSDNLSRVLSLVTCVFSDNLSCVLSLVTCVLSDILSRFSHRERELGINWLRLISGQVTWIHIKWTGLKLLHKKDVWTFVNDMMMDGDTDEWKTKLQTDRHEWYIYYHISMVRHMLTLG